MTTRVSLYDLTTMLSTGKLVQPTITEVTVSARDRNEVRRRNGRSAVIDRKAEAVAELMLEVAQCFFRIRAVGQKAGLITSWGGGAFGFMRSLATRPVDRPADRPDAA